MIQVIVTRSKDSIERIEVSGHAYTNDPGYDLVCAGVSSVMTGALNGFDQLDDNSELIMNEEPYISIRCMTVNKTNQILLQFVLTQLKTIEFSHSDAIQILEKEDIR
ncbi:hypothetical protein AOC36_04765 [Erysipelothrix larvae]|uniref:Ribosomal processing cysteine protease Prp n=1 Tax=Erysipelothrix larvae TaxID=1514105 RepID=A0A0X8GZI2_9FIRM|nr:ribosomal-processing cysteine protease Prp [Erysipelothrix larvae]AMC93309.1 hypothetical protein AOC36_04765 [Erysipelothrix larvae]